MRQNISQNREFFEKLINKPCKKGRFLREDPKKCPYLEFFVVCIFPYSVWIKYFSVFGPDKGKYRPDKTLNKETFHTVPNSFIALKSVNFCKDYPPESIWNVAIFAVKANNMKKIH